MNLDLTGGIATTLNPGCSSALSPGGMVSTQVLNFLALTESTPREVEERAGVSLAGSDGIFSPVHWNSNSLARVSFFTLSNRSLNRIRRHFYEWVYRGIDSSGDGRA